MLDENYYKSLKIGDKVHFIDKRLPYEVTRIRPPLVRETEFPEIYLARFDGDNSDIKCIYCKDHLKKWARTEKEAWMYNVQNLQNSFLKTQDFYNRHFGETTK